MLARFAPTAEVMTEVLERLAERHGGAEGYLAAVGVPRPTWTGCAIGCSRATRAGGPTPRAAVSG